MEANWLTTERLTTERLTPKAEQKRHSARLSKRIRQQLAEQHGRLGFAQFMQQALYAPGLGYYRTNAPKFGAAGDFVTAPLMGNLLARCLAKQCAEVLAEMGAGTVLECGAGNGDLAVEVLLEMHTLGQLPQRYLILETSAVLRARQRATIAKQCAAVRACVTWLTQLPRSGFVGVVLANEVLDAMPALRFEIDAHGRACELGVGVGEGKSQHQFHWVRATKPLPQHWQNRLAKYALESGYRSEIGARAEAWVRTLGDKIKRGVMLLLDYGFPQREFYHAQRRHGTLMCHYQQVAHDDPFFYPGLQDISVHVDFTAIAQVAQTVGLELAGYTSQGAFLLSLGALQKLAESQCSDGVRKPPSLAMSQQLQTLTMPHEMGELFKVIAFSRNYAPPLSGFSLQDRAGRLG